MAGRCVVVKGGFVTCVYSGGLSVRRNGAMFELRLKSSTDPVPPERSMYLDRLLAKLENRQLADSMLVAFELHDPSPGELTKLFPHFSLDFAKKSQNNKKRRKSQKKQEVSNEGSQGGLSAGG